jgi:hypothetical protein
MIKNPLSSSNAAERLSKFKETFLAVFNQLNDHPCSTDEAYADCRWSAEMIIEQAEEDLSHLLERMEKIKQEREDRLERKLGGTY